MELIIHVTKEQLAEFPEEYNPIGYSVHTLNKKDILNNQDTQSNQEFHNKQDTQCLQDIQDTQCSLDIQDIKSTQDNTNSQENHTGSHITGQCSLSSLSSLSITISGASQESQPVFKDHQSSPLQGSCIPLQGSCTPPVSSRSCHQVSVPVPEITKQQQQTRTKPVRFKTRRQRFVNAFKKQKHFVDCFDGRFVNAIKKQNRTVNGRFVNAFRKSKPIVNCVNGHIVDCKPVVTTTTSCSHIPSPIAGIKRLLDLPIPLLPPRTLHIRTISSAVQFNLKRTYQYPPWQQ